MNAPRWQAVRALFDRALELPPDARRELLERAGRGDDALRREVESLLQADAQPDPTLLRLAAPPDETAGDGGDGFEEGSLVGRYRLLRRLGGGGMSVVFLAVASAGEGKQVALKLPRRALVDDDLRARLAREGRVLAALEHPNVARWLDAGEADDGTPYLVMEHVDGLPLDEWCRRQALGTRARLRLFLQVCAGVQHAHRHLVVHRDLKPANVIVGRDGVPKLLDFGIAKLLSPELTRATGTATSSRLRLLTTAYASPEQLRGEPLGVSSDVYALGVLLYELVSETRPFELEGLTHDEAARRVCRVEPPPPSRAAPGRRIERDVDAIVMRALEKEPGRRYASAAELAADIERHLEHLPVKARRPGALERARLAARRNPWAATLALATLLSGAAAAVLARHAARAAERARAERDRAEQVSAFLSDLLAQADPTAAGDAVLGAREILASARRRLAAGAGDDPLLEARLRDALGVVLQRLGRRDEAAGELERAVALRRAHASGSAELAEALSHLAFAYHSQERLDAAAALNREALELRRAAFGPRHLAVAESLHNLAEVEDARGRPRDAERLYRQALALRRELTGGQGALAAESLGELGGLLTSLGRVEEARALLEEAVALRRAGPESAELATYLDYLAEARWAQGDTLAAEADLREAERLQRRLLGEAHSDYADTLFDLGRLRLEIGDAAEAEALLRRALGAWLRAHGPRSRQAAAAHEALSDALVALGRRDEALALWRQALPLQREAFARTRPEIVGRGALRLGRLLRASGDLAAAETALREAVSALDGRPGQALNLAAGRTELGLIAQARGDVSGARAAFADALAIYRRELGESHAWTRKLRARVEGR